MCTLVVAWQINPDYPLIVIGNRDEFYARATQPLHRWANGITAGKDLTAGGTWMGIGPQNQFAALTNRRLGFEQTAATLSRGILVEQALLADNEQQISDYLRAHQGQFAPFNLLYLQNAQLYYCHHLSEQAQRLKPGIYGVSNGLLNEPWPKVQWLKSAALPLLTQPQPDLDALFLLLKNPTTYADALLPDTQIPIEWERLLSALFIATPEYGTRLSSIFLFDKSGKWHLHERHHHGVTSSQTNL